MNILMVAPYFPPFTGVGALRMGSLARFLLKTGNSLTVVKLSDSCHPAGTTGGAQIPGISYVEFSQGRNDKESALRLYSVLDNLAASASFDCCMVSCGPFFPLDPVLRLWKRYSIPFIVDYRDLWLFDPRPVTTLRMFLGQHKQRLLYGKLEKKVLDSCSAFITCTPRCLQIMLDHYPSIKEKSFCVFNGYDFPKKAPVSLQPNDSEKREIQICVLGKLSYYSPHGAEVFFLAVSSLIKKGYPIQIVRAGGTESLEEIFQKTGFPQEHFKDLGQLPYEEAIAAAESAHICTAVISYTRGLGTKIFDYIYLNKPIVAYAPEHSEFEEILSDAENAFVCQSAEQMASALEKIITENRIVLTENEEFIGRFSREDQNKKFLQIITEFSGKGNHN